MTFFVLKPYRQLPFFMALPTEKSYVKRSETKREINVKLTSENLLRSIHDSKTTRILAVVTFNSSGQ